LVNENTILASKSRIKRAIDAYEKDKANIGHLDHTHFTTLWKERQAASENITRKSTDSVRMGITDKSRPPTERKSVEQNNHFSSRPPIASATPESLRRKLDEKLSHPTVRGPLFTHVPRDRPQDILKPYISSSSVGSFEFKHSQNPLVYTKADTRSKLLALIESSGRGSNTLKRSTFDIMHLLKSAHYEEFLVQEIIEKMVYYKTSYETLKGTNLVFEHGGTSHKPSASSLEMDAAIADKLGKQAVGNFIRKSPPIENKRITERSEKTETEVPTEKLQPLQKQVVLEPSNAQTTSVQNAPELATPTKIKTNALKSESKGQADGSRNTAQKELAPRINQGAQSSGRVTSNQQSKTPIVQAAQPKPTTGAAAGTLVSNKGITQSTLVRKNSPPANNQNPTTSSATTNTQKKKVSRSFHDLQEDESAKQPTEDVLDGLNDSKET